MLTNEEISEIRSILSKANDPLYLFDDDGDGLASFLLLKKHFKKGRGKPIKNAGPLDNFYLDYMEEGKPDLIVILDKAVVTQSFIDECPCTVLYIDHHPLQKLKKLKYFNPLKHNKKIYIPTSHMCYKVTEENLWIGVVGCLFDYYIPDFIKDFRKQYPDLINKIPKDPGYIKFETKFGELIKAFAFNLKGKRSEIKEAVVAFEEITSPYEILNQTTNNGKYIYERYKKLDREYQLLLEEAKKTKPEDGLLKFTYPSVRISFTSELATELSYWNKKKTILIAREKDDGYKFSIRNQSRNIRDIFKKSMMGISGYGGGHEKACGGFVKKEDFERFTENIRKNLKTAKIA